MQRSMMTGVAAVLCLATLGISAARADVAPEEDNPKGCTTATSEAETGCGAQGRDHFGNAGHQPPIEACKETVAESGSTVTRIVPDGPRHDDGTLAFTPGVCVYLPPGYATSELHYPVVYLLHGGGGDQSDWVTFGSARATFDAAATDGHPVIAVMPDGRSGQYFDYLDGSFLIETYLLRHLVPDIDARYRTIADRSGRAIAGLSNGGYGALHLAAKAPDLFSVAGAMSGNLGARLMSGLGESGAAYYQGNVPYQLASNLDAVDLIIDWGATCVSDVTVDLCATWAFEQAFRGDNTAFRARLDEVDYQGEVDYREAEGSHAWRWWTTWLAERHVPFFLDRLAPASLTPVSTEVPASFRYRSVFDQLTAWGYEVQVDRDVREFLDLTDVRLDRMTVQGSGAAAVTTAGRYTPGSSYAVAGASDAPLEAEADEAGRLQFTIDLGPSHAQDQFTPQADLAEAAGGYWVQRNVQITPRDEDDPLEDSWPVYDGPTPGASVLAAPVFSPDASAPAAPPAAGDTDVAAPVTDQVAPISNAFAEPVRKVSIPLTALFLSSIGGAVALWWRRRSAGADRDLTAA